MLLPTFFLLLVSLTSARQLEFVQAIWRHGDRAPLAFPYPNDPYPEASWPRGWGELTSTGMEQLNELGQFFRTRYPGFINDSYIPNQVYLRSSDTNRALVSAQAMLSGLYPATGNFQWQLGNSWQPIPVHSTSPGEDDLLCKATSISCPASNALINQGETKDTATYTQMYSDMFTLLRNVTGNPNFAYADVNGIYDIHREISNNLTAKQPSWVQQPWPQYDGRTTLDICSQLRTIRMLNQYGTFQKGRFFGGYLLNNWIETAKDVVNRSQSNPTKMQLYSSHDTVLMAFLYTMGLGDGAMPSYASCVIMEIWSEADQFNIELFYRNSTAFDPVHLTVPGCESPCTVSKFSEIYQNATLQTPNDVKALCGAPLTLCDRQSSTSLNVLPVILIIILSYLFIQ